MKIRSKLLVLIIGIILALGAAAGLYFALLSPLGAMNREQSYLSALSSALEADELEMNKIFSQSLDTQEQSFAASTDRATAAFADLAKVKILPKASPTIAEALGSIASLKTLYDSRLENFSLALASIIDEAKAIFGDASGVALLDFYTRGDGVAASLASRNKVDIAQFKSAANSLSGTLAISRTKLDEQAGIIVKELDNIRAKAILTALGIVILVVALTLFASILFARTIARPIVRLESLIALLKEQDLRGRSGIASKDEIGTLSRNLDLFLDRLSASILRIKEASAENILVRNDLITAASASASAVLQIESGARSIRERIANLDARVENSDSAMGSLSQGISELNAQIEGQGEMVVESTAAVTEMLASLDNMERITERDRASAGELSSGSARGQELFKAAFDRIGEISQSVGSIKDMAGIIASIAARTNLLAMNAAIEAAHAGESGAGFSVVADEIRNLAEASNQRSREISAAIKVIVGKIEEANRSSEATARAFETIDTQVREVSGSIQEIHANISELRTGGGQILDAMNELQDRSVIVRSRAKEMDSSTAAIRETMADMGRASAEVTGRIAEISSGISEIGDRVKTVADRAAILEAVSGRLDAEAGGFVTGIQETR